MNIHFVEKKISNPIRDAFFFDVVVNSNALEYMYVCTISKTSIVFSLNMESLYLIDSDCSSMQVRKAEPFSVFLIVTKSEYRLLFRYNAASVTVSE